MAELTKADALFRPVEPGTQPPYLYPDYKSTAKRAPAATVSSSAVVARESAVTTRV